MSNLGYSNANPIDWAWKVDNSAVKANDVEIKSALMDLTKPIYVAKSNAVSYTHLTLPTTPYV